MRLPILASLQPGAVLPPAAVEGSEHPAAGLSGSWSATRWQYTSRATGRSVDLVCDLGASVFLSFSASSFILAWGVGGGASPTVSGDIRVRGDELILAATPDAYRQTVRFQRAGETLSLSSGASGWDFDGDGIDEDAEFVAVLVRL